MSPPAPMTARALPAIDPAAALALLMLLVGWFFAETLSVGLGPLRHGIRFFELPIIIQRPARLFTGIEAGGSLSRWLFGTSCLLTLMLPLAAAHSGRRLRTLAAVAPLLLMLTCGVLLYGRTSGDAISFARQADEVPSDLVRLANALISRGSRVATRHVSVGAGAYLALLGAVILPLRGLWRDRPGTRRPPGG